MMMMMMKTALRGAFFMHRNMNVEPSYGMMQEEYGRQDEEATKI